MIPLTRFRWLLLALVCVGAAVSAQPPQRQGEQGAQPPEQPGARQRGCDGIDLKDVLSQVAASSGRKFILDPRVVACVRIVPVPQNVTYADLLTILRVHGYMAVEVGGFVNILPESLARQSPTRLVQRDDRNIPDDEWVTRVITVNGNAPQLVPILRPMMPMSAHLAASADLNKLIIFDTYANVRRMTEVIRALTD